MVMLWSQVAVLYKLIQRGLGKSPQPK